MTPGGVPFVQRAARVHRTLLSAAAARDASYLAVARRALDLRLRRGFELSDAGPLGLLDPRVDRRELGRHVSRRELRPLQRRLNPRALEPLTEDKAVFHGFCVGSGIPVPALHAVVRRGRAGWARDGSTPATPEEWASALPVLVDGDVVVKPSKSSFGRGLEVYRRHDASLVDSRGNAVSFGELARRLLADRTFEAWLVQERLRNHEELRSLSGTETLQTIRIITLGDPDGTIRILHAGLKVVLGDAAVDNIRDGSTGNGFAALSLADGRMSTVVARDPVAFRRVEHPTHPRTGVVFGERFVPDWSAVVELVERAARAFLPIRTVGWDVAVTPAGPFLVEGNMWWGSPNECGRMRSILGDLRAAAGSSGFPRRVSRAGPRRFSSP